MSCENDQHTLIGIASKGFNIISDPCFNHGFNFELLQVGLEGSNMGGQHTFQCGPLVSQSGIRQILLNHAFAGRKSEYLEV